MQYTVNVISDIVGVMSDNSYVVINTVVVMSYTRDAMP